MNYFNGFCLRGEEELFSSFTCKSEFCFVGFSYGAIKLLKFLENYDKRVDKIQLISPAFFQTKDERFKKLQLKAFSKNKEFYIENFLKNVASSSKINMQKYLHVETQNELEELLFYNYETDQLENLCTKGIKIEVFLGENDTIIDMHGAKEFFLPFATTYLFKDVGHILA